MRIPKKKFKEGSYVIYNGIPHLVQVNTITETVWLYSYNFKENASTRLLLLNCSDKYYEGDDIIFVEDITKERKETEYIKLCQQFIGFLHRSRGYDLDSLLEAAAATPQEIKRLKKDFKYVFEDLKYSRNE